MDLREVRHGGGEQQGKDHFDSATILPLAASAPAVYSSLNMWRPAFFLCFAVLAPLGAQTAHDAVPDMAIGRRVFESQCALCHGQNGTGGRGPALNRPVLAKAPDVETLRNVIAEGLPPEMPGAWQLSVREVASVAAFVASLGSVTAEKLPGDAERGRTLFRARGCTGCHIVDGAGTPRGPDLTAIGAKRNAAHLRESLTRPEAFLPVGFLIVEAVPEKGEPIVGTRAAEDPFTIQIADGAGRFHSFRKSELKALRRRAGESTMPSFANSLAAPELDDMVAYLAGLRGKQ
ncbi:MAG: c-type cytochrome [Bryobacteraceae bacterium]